MTNGTEKERLLKNVESSLLPYTLSELDREIANNITKAMKAMDRRWFVDNQSQAYIDTALPLAAGQTISQPSTVARMLFLARPLQGDRVLDVGAGSGWQASLLAHMTYPGTVSSIDINDELIDNAKNNLKTARRNLDKDSALMLDTINVNRLNFFELEHPQEFDRIIITAGIQDEDKNSVIEKAKELLAEDGILICPYQLGPLLIVTKIDGAITEEYTIEEFAFVPLIRPSP
ncbi:MAG: protein-L-isoaspartate O-methyltransferase family protein [Candidatus Woesearchaeota archaeon]